MNRTIQAFLARGVDRAKASALSRAGLTVAKLQAKTAAELAGLGLSLDQIEAFQKGARPPVANATLNKLLFENRYQCCVCRDPSKPFIVHHIEEWAESRSHDPSNLAVLCLDHHNRAHTKSTLSQNLDSKSLAGFKVSWETEVRRLDARAVLEALSGTYAHWAFINEMRVIELAGEHGIILNKLNNFSRAKRDKIVDRGGVPFPVETNTFYKYEGATIITRYLYMKELLEELLEIIPVINISDFLDAGVIKTTILEGDFIIVEGAHTFSRLNDVKKGIGQECRGTRSANGVEISFTFDRWGASSSSSKHDWLVATKRAASLLQVRNLERENGRLRVHGTVLAIASFVSSLKTREYDMSRLSWRPRHPGKRPTFQY